MDEVRDEFASYGGIVSGQEIKKIAMAQLARKEAAARDARLRRLAGL